MNNFQDEINLATNGKYNFKCKSAVVDSKTGTMVAEIVYDDGTILDKQAKDACARLASQFFPECKVKINYTKNFLSNGTIKDFVRAYMKSNYVSVKYQIKQINNKDSIFVVVLSVAEEQESYIKSQKILQDVSAALKNRFMTEFMVTAEFLPNMMDFSRIEIMRQEESQNIANQKLIKVSDKKVVIGEEIKEDAAYIRDSKIDGAKVTICGKIKNANVLWTRPKIAPGQNAKDVIDYFKKDVPVSERIEAGQKPYYRFTLQDFTGEILVSVYPKQEDQEKFADVLEKNQPIIVSGTVKDDNFLGINLRAENICSCTLPEVWEEQIDYKSEKPYYEFVQPVDMVYTSQEGLFSMFEEPHVAPYLKDNNIVVFDFETTGLRPYEGDKIVEIGAVKIVNGAIIQSFRTLVNPERHIPESASEVHKIYDKDVASAPKAGEALQDFYKFTRGCVLVGYNVNFDYSFLLTQGKSERYNFDNKTFDCLDLARKSVKGLKNYKLGTIAKELGVSLENAHSALADTIATAEVFIKLADNIKNY